MRTNKKAKVFGVSLTPKSEEYLADIEAVSGSTGRSQAIAHAIFVCHQKMFPAYAAGRATANAGDPNRAEGMLKNKWEMKDLEKKVLKERKQKELLSICEALGGEISEDADGDPVCTWNTYTMTDTYKQSSPVELLKADLPDFQYKPNKELVLKNNPAFKSSNKSNKSK